MLWLVRPLGFLITDRHIRRAGLDYWPHLDWRVVDHLDEVAEALGRDRLWSFSTRASPPYTEAAYRPGRRPGLRPREPGAAGRLARRPARPGRPDPDPARGPEPEPGELRRRSACSRPSARPADAGSSRGAGRV